METVYTTYGSIDIYKDSHSFYIKCRNNKGEESKIRSKSVAALKAKITRSFRYDDLKHNGEYVYIYF